MAECPTQKMKIEINNRQKACRPNLANLKRLVRKLMIRAMDLDPNAKWEEISIVLTDDDVIRDLKTQLFDARHVTDVISLRYDPIPGEKGLLTGEIFVNVERALRRRPGAQRGWNASKELSLYLAHGCDHLMNSTDYDRKGYRRMRRRELQWLKERDIAKLSGNLM